MVVKEFCLRLRTCRESHCYPCEVRGLGVAGSAERTLCLYEPWSLAFHTSKTPSEDHQQAKGTAHLAGEHHISRSVSLE